MISYKRSGVRKTFSSSLSYILVKDRALNTTPEQRMKNRIALDRGNRNRRPKPISLAPVTKFEDNEPCV